MLACLGATVYSSVGKSNTLVFNESFITGLGNSVTFVRATTATNEDFEPLIKTIPISGSRHEGSRGVRNLFTDATDSLAVSAATTAVNVGVGTFVFSMGAGTGTATFSGTAVGSVGTLDADSSNRTGRTLLIATAGTIIVTASVAALVDFQLENVTGQANQNPSEYVSVGVDTGLRDPNVTSNSGFDADTDWLDTGGWTIADGVATCDGSNGKYLYQTNITTSGFTYFISFDVTAYTSGDLKVFIFTEYSANLSISGVGSYSGTVISNGTNAGVYTVNFNGSIDNLTVQKVHHGANIDGLKYFDTENGNTLGTAAFVFTVETTGPSESFTIPCQNNGTFNASIDWGDGAVPSAITAYNDADLAHTYASADTYTIKVYGSFPNIYFNNGGDKAKVRTVVNLGTVGWTILNNAFYGCTGLTSFTAGNCDTSNVANMSNMMRDWTSMTSTPDLTGLDTSSVTNMLAMMYGWTSMTSGPDLTGFDTSSVTNMSYMMSNWTSMTSPPDLTGFDTSSVTNMSYMMYLWTSMTSTPDLSSFNTSSVTDMSLMMSNWTSMTDPPDLTGFNTSSVTSMSSMMYLWTAMTSSPDLSSFNTSSVTNMGNMMRNWTSMGTIGDIGQVDFDITSCTNLLNFMLGTTMTTAAYDALLIAWEAQVEKTGVTAHFGGSTYTSGGAAEAARTELDTTSTWTITDGGAA